MSLGVKVVSGGKAIKEKALTELASQAGVPTAQNYTPAVIHVDQLPSSLEGLSTHSFKGRSRPIVLMLQDFVEGTVGYTNFDNSSLQQEIFFNLVKQLSKVNSIQTKGFGSNYDSKTSTFTFSWKQRLEQMELPDKIYCLTALGMLSSSDIETIHHILEPLTSFRPESTLLHTDTNPGNYKYNGDGTICALLDWEEAEGGPWQYEVAIQIGRIESGTFRMISSERLNRRKAFIEVYSFSRNDLQSNKLIIDAFRLADSLNRLYLYYIKVPDPQVGYKKDAYIAQEQDTYISPKKAELSDYIYSRLGRESVLRRLILEYRSD